jgi:hypothetical protein
LLILLHVKIRREGLRPEAAAGIQAKARNVECRRLRQQADPQIPVPENTDR